MKTGAVTCNVTLEYSKPAAHTTAMSAVYGQFVNRPRAHVHFIYCRTFFHFEFPEADLGRGRGRGTGPS